MKQTGKTVTIYGCYGKKYNRKIYEENGIEYIKMNGVVLPMIQYLGDCKYEIK